MRRIENCVWLDTNPGAAYDYLTTLRNWSRWHPGAVRMEGQIDEPSAVGDTVTEHVRTLGVAGKLRWTTVESVRPSRFVIETTSAEMPFMRRSRLRITYTFEQSGGPAESTRMVRTLDYEFTGFANFLARVYLHEHFKRKTAFALTNLQQLVRREPAGESLGMRGSKALARQRPGALRFVRAALSVCAVTVLVPLLSLASVARAVYLRLIRGNATTILRAHQGSYRPGIFYGAQMVFSKPFDLQKLRDVFFEMVGQAGIERSLARLDFDDEAPRPFPESAAADADHYVGRGTNWVRRGKDCKDMVLWLRVFNGEPGMPTVLQTGLPGGSWDGSSCFNFMKELVARCYGHPHSDVFQGQRLTLRPESARVLNQNSFGAFLLRLPRDIAVNTWSLIWNLTGAVTALGGAGAGPEIVVLNFDESESTRLEAGAEARGVKPYAVLAFAAVNAYRSILGESPHCLVQQASLQTRHYEPKADRNLVGDWLVGSIQRISKDRYSLEDAQYGYEQLVRDLESLGEHVRRAFDAKAYGFLNGGAAVFEALPTYGLDARIWDSVFFNNYGVRSIVSESGFVSWNWAAPFKLRFKAIHANRRTCITLTSYVLGLDTLRAVRNHAEAALRDLMAPMQPGKPV